GDTLPALLAFETQCRVVGPEGERWIPLDQLFQGPGRTALQPAEILTELRLPPPARNSGSLYIKHSPRGAMDIAAIGVASVVTLGQRGQVCEDVKIALGAVAPTPIRAYSAEDLLRGQAITPELVRLVAQEAQRLATSIDDVRATAAYRQSMVAVLVQRTLERSIEMARTPSIPFEVQRRLAIQAAF
ncbi:MAG TPA: FAD binding domain-containing protein, partial [Dehalococcoidia bacterium]|nr:FAD binding domain-containing protein [Dehalococcoidia bacterium]